MLGWAVSAYEISTVMGPGTFITRNRVEQGKTEWEGIWKGLRLARERTLSIPLCSQRASLCGLSKWANLTFLKRGSQSRKNACLAAHVFLSESSCELSLSALLVRPSPGKSQCHFLCPLLVETKLEKERKKK